MENFFRIIIYVALVAVNGFVYYFLHSHFHFLLLVVMLIAPVLSVLLAFYMRSRLEVTVENRVIREKYGYQNKESFVFVKLHNKTWCVSLDAKVELVVRHYYC